MKLEDRRSLLYLLDVAILRSTEQLSTRKKFLKQIMSVAKDAGQKKRDPKVPFSCIAV
jgi:hypothetical protein